MNRPTKGKREKKPQKAKSKDRGGDKRNEQKHSLTDDPEGAAPAVSPENEEPQEPEQTGPLGGIPTKAASKVVDVGRKKPQIPPEKPAPAAAVVTQDTGGFAEDVGLPFGILDEHTMKYIEDTVEDKDIEETLSLIMDHYRGEMKQQARKAKKSRYPKYNYSDIVAMLTRQGIPVPSDDDFARLEATHGTKWDPDGTVVEYYSPVLRSFVPINMRGRYRGCWAEDHCIQGLDISKLDPKPDAIEGFVDRNRQSRIQERYDEMSKVACNEAHLDYLIEMQKQQADILPIGIFYDVLNLGAEVLNENLEILSKEEGLPPNNRIFRTTEEQALRVHKKLQLYAALGLEPLDSTRKGLGSIDPQWEKTRDQMISSILLRRHDIEYKKRTMADHGIAVDDEFFPTVNTENPEKSKKDEVSPTNPPDNGPTANKDNIDVTGDKGIKGKQKHRKSIKKMK